MTTAPLRRSRRAVLPLASGVALAALLLAGCSGGGTGASAGGATEFTYMSLTENTAVADTLTTLSTGACKAENTALPLKITNQPQASIDQQLQLLAGQKALPVLFAAGNTPQLAKDLDKSGQLLNIADTLDDLGASDDLLPAATSTVTSLYGNTIALPTEFNIEGIWYNKQILSDNGITAPTTWDELTDAAATLKDAGVTPFSASGKEGWPITRLVGNYIFRSLGPDALEKVANGDAKLTDPDYVAAAQAVADLGADGYFQDGVGSIDYDTALSEFTNGNAAFFYMGSWALSAFNGDTNEIGADKVGFVPFPSVEGGEGDSTQLGANVGVPLAMSKAAYNDKVGDWLKCIADNYGATALNDQGVLTGFTVNGDAEVPPLTAEVQTQIDAADQSVLWFEALFSSEATTTSQTSAAQLVTGGVSAEDFMAAIQADLG